MDAVMSPTFGIRPYVEEITVRLRPFTRCWILGVTCEPHQTDHGRGEELSPRRVAKIGGIHFATVLQWSLGGAARKQQNYSNPQGRKPQSRYGRSHEQRRSNEAKGDALRAAICVKHQRIQLKKEVVPNHMRSIYAHLTSTCTACLYTGECQRAIQKMAAVAELGALADSTLLSNNSTAARVASRFAKISLSSPGL